MKFDVTEFSLEDGENNLGIFYNEQHVYYRRKPLKGGLNYKFRLKISRHRDCHERLNAMQNGEYDCNWERDIESEVIEFYHTIDLKTLIKKKKLLYL